MWVELQMSDVNSLAERASHLLFRVAIANAFVNGTSSAYPRSDGDAAVPVHKLPVYSLLVATGTSLDVRPIDTEDLPRAVPGCNPGAVVVCH